MTYCKQHKVEFDENLWCPMCLNDEETFREELAKDAAVDAEYFKKEDDYLSSQVGGGS